MPLPHDIIRFLSTIVSIWDLELLLFLRRESPQTWSSETLVRDLRASPAVIAAGLATLQKAALIAKEANGEFCYKPATARLEELVGAVERAYTEFPLAVTEAIFAAPNDRIRVFAEAFRLRKE